MELFKCKIQIYLMIDIISTIVKRNILEYIL